MKLNSQILKKSLEAPTMVEVIDKQLIALIFQFQDLYIPMMKQEAPERCMCFDILNQLILEGSKTGFNLSEVLSNDQAQQVQQSYIRWEVLMRSFLKPENPMCQACRKYMLVSDRAQRLRGFLQKKKHTKYLDIPQLRVWDKDKGKLFDQIVAITDIIHRNKVCKLEQESILSIPYKNRSQIIRRYLQPSLAQQELDQAVQKIQLDLEQESFQDMKYEKIFD